MNKIFSFLLLFLFFIIVYFFLGGVSMTDSADKFFIDKSLENENK